jgi:hypothetical protein
MGKFMIGRGNFFYLIVEIDDMLKSENDKTLESGNLKFKFLKKF